MKQETMTPSQYLAYKPKKKGKYGSERTEVDGIKFHSHKEARRYGVLRIRELAGEITDLELQPKFTITINGKKIFDYFADFRFKIVATGETVVEDVKSPATRKKESYRIKKKAVEAQYSITIIES